MMKQYRGAIRGGSVHKNGVVVLVVVLAGVAGMMSSFRQLPRAGGVKDSVASVAAFMQVYKVLMSPRCVNCHPSGDVPLLGDEGKLHTMQPRRGADGKGMYAMKCANCHQPANAPGLHAPPGSPKWHLPPANMKMVFQGRTPHDLALQLMDLKRNGNKNMEQLIAHADDELVLWGWHPGEGRTLPPLSHAEFKKAWLTWLKKGAYAPPAR